MDKIKELINTVTPLHIHKRKGNYLGTRKKYNSTIMADPFRDAIDLEEQPVYQDVPEFTEINDRLSNKLLDINNFLKNLRKNLKQLDDVVDNYNPGNELSKAHAEKYQKNSVDFINKLMGLFKSLGKDKRSLQEIDQSLLNASQKFVAEKLNTGMKSALEQFNSLQQEFTVLERSLNDKELAQVNDGALIDLGTGSNHNRATQQQLPHSNQNQQQEQMIVEYEPINAEELEYQRNLINEREVEIENISNGIEELNEIFHDLQNIVITQGDVIDNIEANLYDVVHSVKGADKHLTKADKYQRNTRRLCFYLMIILCVVLLFILLVIFA